ncbi:MAG: DUF3326 domain-containing protein [Vampirovibrionales bacterium]
MHVQSSTLTQPPFVVAMVIPTGVGASQGGYGGDAMPWLNAIGTVADVVVTHPNVANAAAFQKLPPHAFYTEGYWLDAWFTGQVAFTPNLRPRLGVLLDAGMEPGMKILQRNTNAAVQTVYGVQCVTVQETEAPLELSIELQPSGASAGRWMNPEAALSVARRMQAEQGINALAIVARMQEPEGSVYASGTGVDPIGGLEAIISHTLSHALGIPCANAPVFDWEEAQPRRDELVSPLTASEYISATFLPCVLTGLVQAPIPVALTHRRALRVEDLSCLVVPHNCLGGVPVLSCVERGIPIITVTSNTTVLPMDMEALLGQAEAERLKRLGLWMPVANYTEALGTLQLLKHRMM